MQYIIFLALIDEIFYSQFRWPSITIKNNDGQKIYVRCHNEEFMEKEINEITKSHDDFKSLLGVAFKETWKEAETIVNILKYYRFFIVYLFLLNKKCYSIPFYLKIFILI